MNSLLLKTPVLATLLSAGLLNVSCPAAAQTGVGIEGAGQGWPVDGELVPYMALHMLSCAGEGQHRDPLSTKVCAFLSLRMPWHAARSFGGLRTAVSAVERSLFESNIARLQSERQEKYAGLLGQYMVAAGSSNQLYEAHIRKLAEVAGGPIPAASTEGRAGSGDLSRNPTRPAVVVSICRSWLADACSRGVCGQVACQLTFVAGLSEQPCWQVKVKLSQLRPDEALSAEFLPGERDPSGGGRRVVLPAATFLPQNGTEQEFALEQAILDVLKSLLPASDAKSP
jgi:hypothetical protein